MTLPFTTTKRPAGRGALSEWHSDLRTYLGSSEWSEDSFIDKEKC